MLAEKTLDGVTLQGRVVVVVQRAGDHVGHQLYQGSFVSWIRSRPSSSIKYRSNWSGTVSAENAIQFRHDAPLSVWQTGEYTGGRYAYVDATAQLKTVLELLENDG